MKNQVMATQDRPLAFAQIPKYALNDIGGLNFDSKAGFEIYTTYVDSKATAEVKNNPMKGSTVREVVIEGVRFKLIIHAAGPVIQKVGPAIEFDAEFALIGVAAIAYYEEAFPMRNFPQFTNPSGWWLLNDGIASIRLGPLTTAGVYTLASEFGIPVFNNFPSDWVISPYISVMFPMDKLFYASPSFKWLCAWAKRYPKILNAKNIEEYYLPDWKAAVRLSVGGAQ